MKQLILLTGLFYCLTVFGQTKIIAYKRVSDNFSNINNYENHNFGEISMPTIRTVTYLKEGCIVQEGNQFCGTPFKDTICNSYLVKNYNYTTQEIKERTFGVDNKTEFINFKLYEKERKAYLKQKPIKQNAFNFQYQILILLLLLSLIFRPKNA